MRLCKMLSILSDPVSAHCWLALMTFPPNMVENLLKRVVSHLLHMYFSLPRRLFLAPFA